MPVNICTENIQILSDFSLSSVKICCCSQFYILVYWMSCVLGWWSDKKRNIDDIISGSEKYQWALFFFFYRKVSVNCFWTSLLYEQLSEVALWICPSKLIANLCFLSLSIQPRVGEAPRRLVLPSPGPFLRSQQPSVVLLQPSGRPHGGGHACTNPRRPRGAEGKFNRRWPVDVGRQSNYTGWGGVRVMRRS